MKNTILLLLVFLFVQQAVYAEWKLLYVIPDGLKMVWVPDKETQPQTEIKTQQKNCILV